MIERVKKIIKYIGLSERAFAEKVGLKQNTLNQQLKGERSLSLDTVSKILISYENISAEWLLRGKGEMILSSSSNVDPDLVEKLKAEVNMLKGENGVLREMLEMKQKKGSTKIA